MMPQGSLYTENQRQNDPLSIDHHQHIGDRVVQTSHLLIGFLFLLDFMVISTGSKSKRQILTRRSPIGVGFCTV